jgi:hypothetical protein
VYYWSKQSKQCKYNFEEHKNHVKIHKQALHWVYLKVQGVEINFINTVTEDASNDSKISSLVSGLVCVSWSRLLIINTKSFVEKTTRIFTGFWTLATFSRWSQSPPLCFSVTVVWFFSIRLTSITLNRSRTELTFYNKSNKLLLLSTQLRHTLLDKQLSGFNKFLHALVFVSFPAGTKRYCIWFRAISQESDVRDQSYPILCQYSCWNVNYI